MANILDLIKGEGLAVMFIKGLAETALSSTEILSQLRANGLGIRTQTGYNVINYFRNTVQPAGQYTKYLNLNSYPTIARLPLSATSQLRNFSYWIKLTGFDKNSGELSSSNIRVSSNNLLTKQQALDIAVAQAAGGGSGNSLDGASGQVTDIYQNSSGLVSP